jgi:hypothetical protein
MSKLDNLFDKLNEAFTKVEFNQDLKALVYDLVGKGYKKGVIFDNVFGFDDNAIVIEALKLNGEKRKLFIDSEEFVLVVWMSKNGENIKKTRLFFDEEEIPNLITILL